MLLTRNTIAGAVARAVLNSPGDPVAERVAHRCAMFDANTPFGGGLSHADAARAYAADCRAREADIAAVALMAKCSRYGVPPAGRLALLP